MNVPVFSFASVARHTSDRGSSHPILKALREPNWKKGENPLNAEGKSGAFAASCWQAQRSGTAP